MEISTLESLWNARKPWFPKLKPINTRWMKPISVPQVYQQNGCDKERHLWCLQKRLPISQSCLIGSNFVYASCYILCIYFGGSEITTCLINNQTYYTTKKSILSIEKRQWKLSTIKCRSPYTGCGQLTQCPNFRSLFTTKVTWHYTWNRTSKR